MSMDFKKVELVNRRQESHRDNFVFPGVDYLDDIEVNGQRVGYVSYGINPLMDCVYINMLKVEPEHQLKDTGLAVLWHLWETHQVPIVPISQYGASMGFWRVARERFLAAGASIDTQLRSCELEAAKQRWQHLVPEADHLRQIRELEASPEWPAIQALIHAREQS